MGEQFPCLEIRWLREGGRAGILLSFSLVLSHSTTSCSVTVTSTLLQFWCLLGYFLASQGAGWMKALSVSIPISCNKYQDSESVV